MLQSLSSKSQLKESLTKVLAKLVYQMQTQDQGEDIKPFGGSQKESLLNYEEDEVMNDAETSEIRDGQNAIGDVSERASSKIRKPIRFEESIDAVVAEATAIGVRAAS